MPQRLSGFDVVKGAAILLVVFGHVWRGLYTAGLIPDAGLYQRVDSAIYLFHMPVFFFLSGVFFSARRPLFDFTKTRMQLLIWPMLLWGWIDAGLKTAVAIPIKGQVLTWPEVALSVLPPVGIFWFLYTLFILHMITWALFRLPRPVHLGVMAVFASAAIMGWVNVSPFESLWNTVIFAPPFFAGVAVAMLAGPDGLLHKRLLWPGLAAFALGQVMVFSGITAGHNLLAALAMALASLGFIAALPNLALPAPIHRTLLALGRITMPIYLTHVIFSAGLRVALRAAGVTDTGLHLVLGTLIGILGPLALIWTARRFGLEGWVGFAPRTNPVSQPVIPR